MQLNSNDKSTEAKLIYKEEREKWLVINDGIINNKKIIIKYQNANGKTSDRIVHPYAMFTYYEANYIVGYCESKKIYDSSN